MGLAMTVYAIQQMGLVSASERLCAETAAVVAACTRYLKALPTTSTDVHADSTECLCTWRPETVLDMFVLLSQKPNRTLIGISMYNADGECTDVQYYKPAASFEESVSAKSDVVLLGQMTIDNASDATTARPVLLIYDGFDTERTEASPHARYAALQSMQASINALAFGHVRCVLQWVGSTEAHARVASMPLPHETAGYLVLKSHLAHELAPCSEAAAAP
jgi:hypothetical protein